MSFAVKGIKERLLVKPCKVKEETLGITYDLAIFSRSHIRISVGDPNVGITRSSWNKSLTNIHGQNNTTTPWCHEY
jgi:hypothetical protein